MEENTRAEHWRELDGVRGLAALLVVYVHLFLIWVPAPSGPAFWLKSLSGHAWTGVHLFFLLSGFLIGGILLKNREAKNYYSVFYIRRAFRIFPPYILLLLVFLVVRYFLAGKFPWGFDDAIPFWSYATLTQNFLIASQDRWGAFVLAITWSVALEEQFYLFLPVWIRVIKRRWLAVSFIALALVGPIFRASHLFGRPNFLVPGAAESLFLGAFLAWMFQAHREWFMSARGRLIVSLLWVVSAIGSIAMIFRHNVGPFDITIIATFWGTFLWMVLSLRDTVWTGWLRSKPLVWLGSISYGVYLFHMTAQYLVFSLIKGVRPTPALGWQGAALALLTFALTLVWAALLFNLIEKRLIARGRNFRYAKNSSEKTTLLEAGASRPVRS